MDERYFMCVMHNDRNVKMMSQFYNNVSHFSMVRVQCTSDKQ